VTTLILGASLERARAYADEKGIGTRSVAARGYIAASPRALEGLRFEDVHIVDGFFERRDWLDMLEVARRSSLKTVTPGVWYLDGRDVSPGYIAGIIAGARIILDNQKKREARR